MDVLIGDRECLTKDVYTQLTHYRYKIFVERLGWNLRVENGEELDQFDRSDTIYVIARGDFGNITGCARLLPTTRPYLLAGVFPGLLNGATPPCSPEVWELSRFAAVDLNYRSTSRIEQFSSPIAMGLMRESIASAAALGAKRLITVSPIGVERLLRRGGIKAHRAGPPMVVEGHTLVACVIEVS